MKKKNHFSYLISQSVVYICCCSLKSPSNVRKEFLLELKTQFQRTISKSSFISFKSLCFYEIWYFNSIFFFFFFFLKKKIKLTKTKQKS